MGKGCKVVVCGMASVGKIAILEAEANQDEVGAPGKINR